MSTLKKNMWVEFHKEPHQVIEVSDASATIMSRVGGKRLNISANSDLPIYSEDASKNFRLINMEVNEDGVIVKKGRGRPKGSGKKKLSDLELIEEYNKKAIRKRGRPKGSMKMSSIDEEGIVNEAPKKRGRPKGSKKKR